MYISAFMGSMEALAPALAPADKEKISLLNAQAKADKIREKLLSDPRTLTQAQQFLEKDGFTVERLPVGAKKNPVGLHEGETHCLAARLLEKNGYLVKAPPEQVKIAQKVQIAQEVRTAQEVRIVKRLSLLQRISNATSFLLQNIGFLSSGG